jgi:hypothetical protein
MQSHDNSTNGNRQKNKGENMKTRLKTLQVLVLASSLGCASIETKQYQRMFGTKEVQVTDVRELREYLPLQKYSVDEIYTRTFCTADPTLILMSQIQKEGHEARANVFKLEKTFYRRGTRCYSGTYFRVETWNEQNTR